MDPGMDIAHLPGIQWKGTAMTDNAFTILIADRNPHVREFLKREMAAEGYRVRLAENGKDVLKWSYAPEPLDLLILDPDLPDVDANTLLARLADRIPALPMVIHTFLSDFSAPEASAGDIAFVEKRGSSIESLKQIVERLLVRSNSTKRVPVE